MALGFLIAIHDLARSSAYLAGITGQIIDNAGVPVDGVIPGKHR